MIRTLSVATILTIGLAFSAMAGPADTKNDKVAATATTAPQAAPFVLSEQEAKAWINKPVYSSDGKKIGEVVDFQRDADNKVISLHIDIGGFLGVGQTRVSLTALQFKLQTDSVLLNLTAAEAKELPRVPA
jgi:hypothetical protein